MRKTKNILAILLLWAALAGCTKHERVVDPEAIGYKPISFSTTTEESKADVTLEDLKASGDGWGIYAYYTGTSDYTKPSDAEGIIFNERKVYWNTADSPVPWATCSTLKPIANNFLAISNWLSALPSALPSAKPSAWPVSLFSTVL